MTTTEDSNMSVFTKQMEAEGIADTRTLSIEMAFERLHASLCQMDNSNIAKFNKMFPGVAMATNKWAATCPFTRALTED